MIAESRKELQVSWLVTLHQILGGWSYCDRKPAPQPCRQAHASKFPSRVCSLQGEHHSRQKRSLVQSYICFTRDITARSTQFFSLSSISAPARFPDYIARAMTTEHILRIPRSDSEGDFVLINITSNGKSALDLRLLATEGESPYITKSEPIASASLDSD